MDKNCATPCGQSGSASKIVLVIRMMDHDEERNSYKTQQYIYCVIYMDLFCAHSTCETGDFVPLDQYFRKAIVTCSLCGSAIFWP